MSKIHLKLYNFEERADQIETKRQFKEFFAWPYAEKYNDKISEFEKTGKDIDEDQQAREDAITKAAKDGESKGEEGDEFFQEV